MGMVITTCTFAQQPGDLDLNFGTDGISTVDANSQGLDDGANMITVQSDGGLLVVGRIKTGTFVTESDMLIARYSTDGIVDPQFGQSGFTITDLGGEFESLFGIYEKPDGKILAGGSSNQSGNSQQTLIQYNENGLIDQNFGNNGVIYTSATLSSASITSMVSDSDGNVLTTGSGNGNILVVKFENNGTLYNSFGTSGVAIHDLGLIESGYEMLLQTDGKILVTGTQNESGNPENGIVVRLESDGSLDLTFNGTGWVDLALSENTDRSTDLALLPDGRILVTGIVPNASVTALEIFAVRLMPDGSYDNTFGTNGIARYDIGAGDDYANDVILQPDGKAIIGGYENDGNDNNFCLIRINEDGTLDQTFGDNGVVITEVSTDNDRIASMALQPDGKLVVAGSARIGTNDDIALARYHTGLNLSVNDRDEKPLFSVYPSPATGYLSISSKVKLQTIELTDALGKKVLTVKPNSNQMQLDIALLPSGIYLLRATDGQRLYTQKVVKE